MPLEREWIHGYAAQARADLKTFRILLEYDRRVVPKCHVLQFLQMACEKFVKAHMIRDMNVAPDQLRRHAVVRRHLPNLLSLYYSRRKQGSLPRHLFGRWRQLAREIELLAPAVDDAGRRPPNSEYPWEDAAHTRVFVPAQYGFASLDLKKDQAILGIVGALAAILDQLLA